MYIDLKKVVKGLIRSEGDWFSFINRRVASINNHYEAYGFKKAVIGLSGGLDSAVSAALGVKALGAKNVIAYSLPYSDELHSDSSNVAQQVADSLKIDLRTVSIKPIVDALINSMPGFESNLGIGNASARARMMVLMHAATAEHALVLGTENKTEEQLAYYTIGGDDTTHVEPIHDLFKVEVFQLGQELNLPKAVLNRAPSAELWSGQTDEEELGANYEHIDNVLFTFENSQKGTDCLIHNKKTEAILNRLKRVCGKRACPTKLL